MGAVPLMQQQVLLTHHPGDGRSNRRKHEGAKLLSFHQEKAKAMAWNDSCSHFPAGVVIPPCHCQGSSLQDGAPRPTGFPSFTSWAFLRPCFHCPTSRRALPMINKLLSNMARAAIKGLRRPQAARPTAKPL